MNDQAMRRQQKSLEQILYGPQQKHSNFKRWEVQGIVRLKLQTRLGNDSWGIDTVSILDSISQVLQISIRIDKESILYRFLPRTFLFFFPYFFLSYMTILFKLYI
jgi:hypothetical protein